MGNADIRIPGARLPFTEIPEARIQRQAAPFLLRVFAIPCSRMMVSTFWRWRRAVEVLAVARQGQPLLRESNFAWSYLKVLEVLQRVYLVVSEGAVCYAYTLCWRMYRLKGRWQL
ncbi:hypothetical protein NPIL_605801 [Nephila pilipes]|uniref:Uncharacterized protein n=1 Tax=Nephila pilipes TaxID=299642 RepID=A0A8X6T9L8_NEPPI|nr:hypothetical protein NPIL_605801 [Nephila pilipes]